MLQLQANVMNLRILANCVWNYAPVEIHSANNLGMRIFRFPHFNTLFAYNTSNAAAWFYDQLK